MNVAGRVIGFAAIGLMLTFCAALGSWWWVDHNASYESPHWDASQFESIGPVATVAAVERRETWVIAVNPDCHHCMAMLASLADTLAVAAAAPRLYALVIDAPVRPAGSAVTHRRLDGVFWDRDQVWRRRWGHRVYGELMRFDAAGEWIAATHRADETPPAGGSR